MHIFSFVLKFNSAQNPIIIFIFYLSNIFFTQFLQMTKAIEDREEKIKKWFEEVMDNDISDIVDHGMRHIEQSDREEIHRRRRGKTPPWMYLFRNEWRRTEGHSTIAGWLQGHKYKRERNYLSETMKSMRKFYFPNWKVEEDNDILFEMEMNGEKRQKMQFGQNDYIDNQQPSTSAVALREEMLDLIIISDNLNKEEKKQISNRGMFDVFTLNRHNASQGTKRTTGKSKASPKMKKTNRRPNIPGYFPILTID